MKGDLRCIEGRLFRHDPQHDDPDLETDVGECPDCSGDGCGDDGEPVPKRGMSDAWLWREASSAKNTHLEIEARRRAGAAGRRPAEGVEDEKEPRF